MADGDMGVAALALGQGFSGFQWFLPKLADVRKADSKVDTDMVGDVRMGEFAAVTYTLGVGIIASAITKTPVPAYVSAALSIVLVCLYETALRNNRPGNPPATARSADA